MSNRFERLKTGAAFAALLVCSACADGKTSSFSQAPIFFGNAGQGAAGNTATVVEPDGSNFVGLGGDVLLPTAAPAPATPVTQPADVTTQAAVASLSASAAPQGVTSVIAAPIAQVTTSVGAGGVATTVQTPVASVAAQVNVAPVTQALAPALAAPVVSGAAGAVTPVVSAALATSGSVLGEVNLLATTTAAVTSPLTTNLLNTASSNTRRGACVLHLGC